MLRKYAFKTLVFWALLLTTTTGAALNGLARQGFSGLASTQKEEYEDTTYRIGTPFQSFEVQAAGAITFSENGLDIVAMGSNALLSIKERRFFRSQQIFFGSDPTGTLQRTYLVNGRARELDEAAEAWVREALLKTARKTGIGAASRARYILATEGPEALLEATRNLGIGTGKCIYLETLFTGDLTESVAIEGVLLAPEAITDNSRLKELLISIADQYGGTTALSFALVKAGGEIPSSTERVIAIETLIHKVPHGERSGVALAEAITAIPSNSAKASAIIAAIPYLATMNDAMAELLRAAASINSSGEKARALQALTEVPDLVPSSYIGMVKVAGSIPSDGERTRLLISTLQQAQYSDAFVQAYLAVVESISSSPDRSNALMALITGGPLTEGQIVATFSVTEQLSSGPDKQLILETAASEFQLSEAAMQAYRKAEETIPSSGQSWAEKTLPKWLCWLFA